jgi:hypothetical protein
MRRIIIVLAALLVAAGCAKSTTTTTTTAPWYAVNGGAHVGIVRLVGRSGSADLRVPASTAVRLVAPSSIGTVRVFFVMNLDCTQKSGGASFDLTPFDVGGVLDFGDADGYGTSGEWTRSDPAPTSNAQTTTECQDSPTPGGTFWDSWTGDSRSAD